MFQRQARGRSAGRAPAQAAPFLVAVAIFATTAALAGAVAHDHDLALLAAGGGQPAAHHAWGTPLPWLVLIGGALLAVTSAVALRVITVARNRARMLAALNRDLEARVRQQGAVAAVSRSALGAPALDALLAEAGRQLATALDADVSVVFEARAGEIVLRAGHGWPADTVGKRLAPLPGSLVDEVLASGEPLVLPDFPAARRMLDDGPFRGHGVVSALAVAIPGADGPWGVLGAGSRTPREFTCDDVHLLQALANVLGAALARRRVEQTLREVEARLRELLRHSPAVLFSLEPEPPYATRYASENVERLLGFPARVFQDGAFWPSRVHPDDLAEASTGTQRCRDEGEAAFDYRFAHADGSWRLLHNQLSLVRDADGSPHEIVGVSHDVTRQRQLEEELRNAAKMEAIGRLAGGVAHDFNNLLTSIGGYGELALLGLPPGHPARDDVEQIRAAADRAATLTRQLLAFSRRQVLQPRQLDLNRLVEECLRSFARVLGEDVEVAVELAPVSLPVQADPGQLEQVLVNLALNARDAMPTGGRLTIATGEAFQRRAGDPASAAAAHWVFLRVGDSGEGMAPEVAARVFEPFFSARAAGPSTGLGLSMVHGIVHQSGGWIEVETSPGVGSAFTVFLPRRDPPAAAADAAPAPAAAAEAATVLVAEDEEQVRLLVVRALEAHGYRVLAAAGGEEALALAAAAPRVDLLISDVVMPDLRGPELHRRLLGSHPGTPVLFVSGYADRDLAEVGAGAGVGFLAKPFSPLELVRRVREALAGASPS